MCARGYRKSLPCFCLFFPPTVQASTIPPPPHPIQISLPPAGHFICARWCLPEKLRTGDTGANLSHACFFSSCLRAGDQVNQVICPANTRRCNNFHSCQQTDRKWKAESLKSAHPARQRKATLICTCCVSPLA